MYEQLTDEQMQQIWNQEAAADAPVEPVPTEAPTDAPTEAPTPAATEAVADPYEGLPDAVKARLAKIDDLERTNATLTHELRSTIGRVGALQREFDLAKQAKQQAQQDGGTAPTSAQMAAAAKSSEKWEKLKTEFPDWADAIEERFGAQAVSPQSSIDPEQIAGFVNQQVSNSREEIAREIELAKIESRHENWTETVQTEKFKAWFESASPEIKALAESPKARDAIRMLDEFQKAQSTNVSGVKQERGARLSVAATQVGQSAPPAKDVDNMSPAELWAYEAKLREKRKQAY